VNLFTNNFDGKVLKVIINNAKKIEKIICSGKNLNPFDNCNKANNIKIKIGVWLMLAKDSFLIIK
jgi:hypothetical protein